MLSKSSMSFIKDYPEANKAIYVKTLSALGGADSQEPLSP
jgi:hypothetical protein